MRIFRQDELKEALAHAAEGGQALHLHRIIVNRKTAPRVFVAAVDSGQDIAHLFDQDRERLVKTAQTLGINVIKIDGEGEDGQHIDLCFGPLRLAKAMAESEIAHGG